LEEGATRRGVPEDGRARGDEAEALGSRGADKGPATGLACLGKTRDMAAAMAADVCITPALVAVSIASDSDHVVVEDEDREKVEDDGEVGVLRGRGVTTATATRDAVSTGAVSSSSSSSSSLGD
jgi:hypothetical protein